MATLAYCGPPLPVPTLWVVLRPVLLVLAYIYGLRQGKPPGYDRDFLEYLLNGRGFGPEADRVRVPKHPLL